MRFHSAHTPEKLLVRGINLLLILSTVFSCTKKGEPLSEIEQVKLYLTGTGNRYWRIREIYSNGTKVTLTGSQLDYFKTYTIALLNSNSENSGTFADSDGFRGNWILTNPTHMQETIENNPLMPVKINFTIKEIGQHKLDIEYIANGDTTRTVYFAY